MPKPKGRSALVDHDEVAWRAEHKRRAESEEVYHEAPPLPTWSAPAHVKRELLGRFLEDRETGVIHDVQHATVACDVDAIRNGTFYHFLSEIPDGTDCPHCIGG